MSNKTDSIQQDDLVTNVNHQELEPVRSQSSLSVQAPNNKTTCDEPAYLFWKIQSQLAKLTNRLREEKKIILEQQTPDSNKRALPCKDND